MSDVQFYVSVAVMPTVTIIVVLIGVLLSNNTLNARLSDLRSEMNARFGEMNARFGEMNLRLGDVRDTLRAEMGKNHSEMLSQFAELDLRLSRLEAGSG